MSNSLDFMMRLIDQASGPAGKIAGSLDRVNASLSKLGHASFSVGNRLDHITAPRTLGGFSRLSQFIGNTFGAKAHGAFMGAASSLGKVDDALQSVGTSLGEVGMGLAKGAAIVGGALVVGAVAFGAAATKFGISAVDFRTSTIAGFTDILKSSTAASALYEKALDIAAKTGMGKDQVVSKISEMIAQGMKPSEALARVRELAAKASGTVAAQASRVGIAFGRLFDKIDFSPLKKALGGIADFLSGPGGDKVRAAIEKIFAAGMRIVTALFGDLSDPANLDKIANAFVAIGDGAANAATLIEKFSGLLSGTGQGGVALNTIAASFEIVAFAASMTIDPLGTMAATFGMVSGAAAAALAAVEGTVSGFVSAGFNMAMGLAEGITSGASAAVNAAISLAQSVVSAVEESLDIHSPSRVMGRLGAFTAQGLAGGMANDNSVPTAAHEMANGAVSGAAAGAGAGLGAGGGGFGGAPVFNIPITVNGGSDPASVLEEAVRRGVDEALREYQRRAG